MGQMGAFYLVLGIGGWIWLGRQRGAAGDRALWP